MRSETESSALLIRLERLERHNRVLTLLCGLCLAVPLLCLVGWRSGDQGAAQPSVLKVKSLQVVDDRGVPLVTLGPDRTGSGGMITLRDKLGERRSWWEVGPYSAAFTLSSDEPSGGNDNTLGFAVGPKNSLLTVMGKSGALVSTEINDDGPHFEMLNPGGKSLFSAPWKTTH